MKKLVKIAAVAVLSLGFGVAAQAQTVNQTLSVGATVRDQLEIVKGSDLQFGVVMRGANKMINAQGGVSSSNGTVSTSNTSVGRFTVYAGAGSSVTLTVASTGILTSTSDANVTMPLVFNKSLADENVIEPTVGYGLASSDVTELTMLEIGAPKSITFPSTTIGEGQAARTATNVWVGGIVKPSGTQLNGGYTGVVTLTASYN